MPRYPLNFQKTLDNNKPNQIQQIEEKIKTNKKPEQAVELTYV